MEERSELHKLSKNSTSFEIAHHLPLLICPVHYCQFFPLHCQSEDRNNKDSVWLRLTDVVRETHFINNKHLTSWPHSMVLHSSKNVNAIVCHLYTCRNLGLVARADLYGASRSPCAPIQSSIVNVWLFALQVVHLCLEVVIWNQNRAVQCEHSL